MAYDYILPTGTVIADTSETLAEVQAEYQDAFGADLDLSPATPQGVLISAETASRDGIARNNALLANQINPNLATGVFLDAICALMGIERLPATKSILTATITGTAGTIIPAGARAETNQGVRFALVSETTIPSGGEIDATFQSVDFGPIECAAGALTNIVDAVLGWESVINDLSATLGTNQESDLALWRRRRQSLALMGTQTTEAIISALSQLRDVRSFKLLENVSASTQTIEGVSMVAHSIWVCAYGGEDGDIARVLLDNKSAGCAFNGAVEVPTEAASGQIITVKFDRPSVIDVLCRATIRNSTSAGDIVAQIKARVVAYANGEVEGEDGFKVGASVSAYELAGVIATIPGVYAKKVEVAPASTAVYSDTVAIAANEVAAIIENSVTVIIE